MMDLILEYSTLTMQNIIDNEEYYDFVCDGDTAKITMFNKTEINGVLRAFW